MRRPIALLIVLFLALAAFNIGLIIVNDETAVNEQDAKDNIEDQVSKSRRVYHPIVFEDFVEDGDGADSGTYYALVDEDIPYYNDWCKGWKLRMLTGSNKDTEREIGGYNALIHTLNWSIPFPNPIKEGDQYRIYLTDYDMMNIYYMACQNMTGDVHYLDLVPHISNGDSENIGFPGLNWEDINLTYTPINRMNFSYPRAGLAQAKKGLYCAYDDTTVPFCNLTINGLGMLVMGSPVGGKDKEINCEVWFDTDGNYDIIQDTGDIEGIMGFDFQPDTAPFYNGGTGVWENVEPYITHCDRFYALGQQEEEYADGVGFWKLEPSAAEKDMNSGQFFITLWRSDQVADDDNNATADFKLYCGFTNKLSFFNLPYKHPLVNPVAEARAKLAGDTGPTGEYAGYNDTLGQTPIRENEDIFFDGSNSYDPQDDTGMNGIAFGDPSWGPPNDPDLGEADGIIQDGDPEGEPNYNEVDNLQYRWIWGTGNQDSGWLNSPYVTHKFKLPSKIPFMVYEVKLQVRDPEMHMDEDICFVKVWDDPGTAPFVDVVIHPDNEEAKITTILKGQTFQVTGSAFDPDPEQELSYYWDLNNYDADKAVEWVPGFFEEFQDPEELAKVNETEFTLKYDIPGFYRITLNVFDGPLYNETGVWNIDTLNNTDYIIVEVVENEAPEGSISAKLVGSSLEPATESIDVRNNQDIEFTVTGVDNDLLPGFDKEEDDYETEYNIEYDWDFGDGVKQAWTTDNKLTHNYTDKGSSNNNYEYYTVTVKLRDGEEADTNTLITTLEPFKVYVNLAPDAEAGPNLPNVDYGKEIQAEDLVYFNGSGSYDPNDDTNNNGIVSENDGETDNLRYSWNFGDKTGAAEGKFPTHTYSKADTYTVQLTVTDKGGRMASDTMTVTVVAENEEPHLEVEVFEKEDPTNRMVGKEITVYTSDDITFDAKNSFDPDGKAYTDDKNSTVPHEDLAFSWDFGVNGSQTSTYYAIYSYPEDGTYDVSLSITDKSHDRKFTVTETYKVIVKNRVPFAMLKADPQGTSGEDILFDGRGSYDVDGEIVQYSWEWGDEEKQPFGNDSTNKHEYDKPGVYKVKLWVMDDDGDASIAAEMNLTVNQPKKKDSGGLIPGYEVGVLIAVVSMLGVVAVLGNYGGVSLFRRKRMK